MSHTTRTIAEGSDLWAFIETTAGETKTYKPIASQTNCSISDDSDQLESTSKNVGKFANYQYGRERWSASVEMMAPSDTDANEVSLEDLILMKKKKTKPIIFFAHVDADGEIDTTRKAFRGQVLLKVPVTANDGELRKETISMQGCLELEYLEYKTTAWEKVALT